MHRHAVGCLRDARHDVTELHAALHGGSHRFANALHAVPRGVAETVLRSDGALAFRECTAKQQQQRRNVAGVAAEAHVEPIGEFDRALAQSLAAEPVVRRHVERGVLRQCPVAGLLQRVRAHRQHAVVIPRHVLPIRRGEIVHGVGGPVGLADDLAAIHEILLAKEFENGRHVHELDAVALGGADYARVAGADVRAPGFRSVAELAHRMNAAADALLRFEHENAEARGFERQRRVQTRNARAHDHYVSVQRQLPVLVGSSTPVSDGFGGPGRPDRQQSGAQRSWLGPKDPSARRGAPAVMRSTTSSRIIAM
jgi:hypothetical protein